MVFILNLIQEILEEFFSKLEEDNEVPNHLTSELKKLWLETKFDSKKSILNLIKESFGDNIED